jgi:hypothetical protein
MPQQDPNARRQRQPRSDRLTGIGPDLVHQAAAGAFSTAGAMQMLSPRDLLDESRALRTEELNWRNQAMREQEFQTAQARQPWVDQMAWHQQDRQERMFQAEQEHRANEARRRAEEFEHSMDQWRVAEQEADLRIRAANQNLAKAEDINQALLGASELFANPDPYRVSNWGQAAIVEAELLRVGAGDTPNGQIAIARAQEIIKQEAEINEQMKMFEILLPNEDLPYSAEDPDVLDLATLLIKNKQALTVFENTEVYGKNMDAADYATWQHISSATADPSNQVLLWRSHKHNRDVLGLLHGAGLLPPADPANPESSYLDRFRTLIPGTGGETGIDPQYSYSGGKHSVEEALTRTMSEGEQIRHRKKVVAHFPVIKGNSYLEGLLAEADTPKEFLEIREEANAVLHGVESTGKALKDLLIMQQNAMFQPKDGFRNPTDMVFKQGESDSVPDNASTTKKLAERAAAAALIAGGGGGKDETETEAKTSGDAATNVAGLPLPTRGRLTKSIYASSYADPSKTDPDN